MKAVGEMADRHGVELRLMAEEFDIGGPSKDKLLTWYRRCGFEGNAEQMVRRPRQQPLER